MQDVGDRHVYRNRQRCVTALDPVMDPAADVVPNIQIQVRDQPALFEYGDERIGRNDRSVGLDPTRQRLGADDLAR